MCAQQMVSISRRSSISAPGAIGDKGMLLLTCMKECRKFKTEEVIGEGGGVTLGLYHNQSVERIKGNQATFR